jgi:hypothetical protein
MTEVLGRGPLGVESRKRSQVLWVSAPDSVVQIPKVNLGGP